MQIQGVVFVGINSPVDVFFALCYFLCMETVFDIATPQELVDLFGEDEPEYLHGLSHYDYIKKCALEDPDFNYADLAALYFLQGLTEKADRYVAMIKNDERRLCSSMMLHECTAGY